MDWKDIHYLKMGTGRQRLAWATLRRLRLPERLAAFDATLVSTVCVGLDIESSDLDIICEVENGRIFEEILRRYFGDMPGFVFRRRAGERPEWVARFLTAAFPIECFGAPVPVERQNAYRHLTVMWRLLQIGGDSLRVAVRDLKRSGLKTEPAFARLLGLSGDPYEAFLNLEALDDKALARLLEQGSDRSG
jgi:hypothetical protein